MRGRAVFFKRILILLIYMPWVLIILYWLPSKDPDTGRVIFDKKDFIINQLCTLLLLLQAIFSALAAPDFAVCSVGTPWLPSLHVPGDGRQTEVISLHGRPAGGLSRVAQEAL